MESAGAPSRLDGENDRRTEVGMTLRFLAQETEKNKMEFLSLAGKMRKEENRVQWCV